MTTDRFDYILSTLALIVPRKLDQSSSKVFGTGSRALSVNSSYCQIVKEQLSLRDSVYWYEGRARRTRSCLSLKQLQTLHPGSWVNSKEAEHLPGGKRQGEEMGNPGSCHTRVHDRWKPQPKKFIPNSVQNQ